MNAEWEGLASAVGVALDLPFGFALWPNMFSLSEVLSSLILFVGAASSGTKRGSGEDRFRESSLVVGEDPDETSTTDELANLGVCVGIVAALGV